MKLVNGSKIAIIGGGPAGSLSAFFLLRMAKESGLDLTVDIFEPRDFNNTGPKGCNMCGGVISESLVQLLTTEGIHLPRQVVIDTIDSYILHTQAGSISIQTSEREKRIASIFRGGGPRGADSRRPPPWDSFDAFLLGIAIDHGATHHLKRVTTLSWDSGRPQLTWNGGVATYDLLVGTTGLNGAGARLFQALDFGYEPPKSSKAYICDFHFGTQTVTRYLQQAMHIFLLDIPGLEFAAITPKGPYVTLIILGEEINNELIDLVLNHPEVRTCFPPEWKSKRYSCHCQPRIYLGAPKNPYSDRVVMVGDCGVSRLYKDGIGAAYQAAKVCAMTVIHHGIAKSDFDDHYQPALKAMDQDNELGHKVFKLVGIARRSPPLNKSLLRAIWQEKHRGDKSKAYLTGALWDTFTGSAPYRDILARFLNPSAIANILWQSIKEFFSMDSGLLRPDGEMPTSLQIWNSRLDLGTIYQDGETIVGQGDICQGMYVILDGKVEILIENDHGLEVRVAILEKDNILGTHSLFGEEPLTYSARALGATRLLTVDRKGLLRWVERDPTLAMRIIHKLTERIRTLHLETANSHDGEDESHVILWSALYAEESNRC